jgi:UDP-glucose 4-epimerase
MGEPDVPEISNRRFVVLGGASQVGFHIGRQLLDVGAREVVLLDNLSLGSLGSLRSLLDDPRCSFVKADILVPGDLETNLTGADGVFAVAGIMASTMRENPAFGLDVNVHGALNALEACHKMGVKKIVISSSVGVYGLTGPQDTDEGSPLRWQDTPTQLMLYSASKVIGEALAQLYREKYGTDYVALRYSGVYGENQHRRALRGGHIADSCARLRQGLPAIIDGDGSVVQDYVHAADVARANLMAMESAVSGEAMNICAGYDLAQKDLVEIIIRICGSNVPPEFRPVTVNRLPPVSRQAYSREKARRLLGWEPQISIEEGVARVLAWIDSEGGWTA